MTVALKSCSASIDHDLYFDVSRKEKGKKPRRRIEESYSVIGIGDNFFDCEGAFVVSMFDPARTEVRLLNVECTYEVHMHAQPELLNHGLVKKFTDSQLRLVLLPFARQFVTETTAKMVIPPVFMPLAVSADRGKSSPRASVAKKEHDVKD